MLNANGFQGQFFRLLEVILAGCRQREIKDRGVVLGVGF
jgi:hypothetical protein